MTGTLHILPVDARSQDRLRLHETAGEAGVLLGMPHLCIGGIYETWLLRELGHRHWLMVAHAAGRAVPDFRDQDGAGVYAAFNAVSLRGTKMNAARENDNLSFVSAIARLSRTQFRTTHHLFLNGERIGTVELISVFVKRTIKGRNRSVVRVDVPGLPPIAPGEGAGRLVNDAAAIRSDCWSEHMGFARVAARELFRYEIDPCPTQDFNGAGFLYCASFQAFIDRAEWAVRRDREHALVTTCRDIIFRGNIEVGENIAVVLLAHQETDGGFKHWFRVKRIEDDQTLADVFTTRAFA